MKKQASIKYDELLQPELEHIMELTGLSKSAVFELALSILSTYPDKFILMEMMGHAPKDYRRKENKHDRDD